MFPSPKSQRRLFSAFNLGGLTPWEASKRTWAKMEEHEILTRAAAISFYAMAALVPFLALVLTFSGWFIPWLTWIFPSLIPEPSGVPGESAPNAFMILEKLLPADAASVVTRELDSLQTKPVSGIISVGVAALLWISSSLFVVIMDSMNRIMGVQETRPIWKVRLIAMLMTISQAAILIVVFISTLIWPQIMKWMGLSSAAAALATLIQGLTVFALILMSYSLAMYFGPDAEQRWEWISPGSLLGTLVLLCVSLLFRAYVQTWGNYTATYGSLAGVVVLMSWLWISSVELLAAAELNKVIEDASPLGKPYGQRREKRS